VAGAAKQARIAPCRTLLQIRQRRWRAFQEEHDHGLGDIWPRLAVEMTQTFEDGFIYRCFAPMRRRPVAWVFWIRRQLSGSLARNARTCPNKNLRFRLD
jgi:hypothetical protein